MNKFFSKNSHCNARQRKVWKNRVKEKIKGQFCAQCKESGENSPLVDHHISPDPYLFKNFHLYETLSDELEIIILCKKCHFAFHKGMLLCPKCRVKYRQRHYSTCYNCSGVSKKESLLDTIHDSLEKY